MPCLVGIHEETCSVLNGNQGGVDGGGKEEGRWERDWVQRRKEKLQLLSKKLIIRIITEIVNKNIKVVQLFLMVCSLFLSEIITVSHRHTKHLPPFSPASLGSLRTLPISSFRWLFLRVEFWAWHYF